VLREHGAHVLLTADHGNADDLGSEANPHTAHTLNLVPLVYLAPAGGTDGTGDLSGGRSVRDGGTLADIAPTLLEVMGVDQPGAMTGESLLE